MKQPVKEEIVWKEFIDLRHSKDEKSRQNLRKIVNRSSRFLDNYYNPGMHEKSWFPNGKKIDKRKYVHCQTGLCHFYEQGYVLQKLDNEEKSKKRVEEKHFLEFEYMQKNDILVTIEHCSNCEDHQTHTQHINDIYRFFAQSLQKCILMRFPFIKVYLKPIDTEIVPIGLQKYEKNPIVDLKYKDVRIGAFEIQLAIKKEKLEIVHIHSKLSTGLWPSLSAVLNKIVARLPRFNLSISIFDREDKIEDELKDPVNIAISNDEQIKAMKSDDEMLLPTKFENIKINLYQLKNPQILQIISQSNEELDKVLNPKKRIALVAQTRLIQREMHGDLNDKEYSEVLSTNLMSIRPMTSRSILSNKIDNMKSNIVSSRLQSASTIRPSSVNTYRKHPKTKRDDVRPASSVRSAVSNYSLSKIGFNFNTKSDLIIEDKDVIENLKGTLIRTVYSDREGKHILDPLPHDTYLIEIENSKNFIGCGLIFKTNFIVEGKNDAKKSKNEVHNIGATIKLIGLKRQTDSYVSVYISFIKDEENYDFTPLKDCKIILRKLTDSKTESFMEEENKIFIPENKKIDGRYDIIIVPGKYIIEVYKTGYDIVRKEIELISGENNLNIDLNIEKKYYLNVNVINYETGAALDKAMINITYSKNDEITQGLTDKNGIYQLLTSKNEDFINILVNKDGFFTVQRSYVREIQNANIKNTNNKDIQTIEKVSKSESETINRDIYVYLLREGFVIENSLILLFTYTNSFENNFLPIVLETNMPDPDLKNVVIAHDDRQKPQGVLITIIKYEKKTYTEEKEQIHRENNNDQDEETPEEETYPEIVRFMLKIQNREFLEYYEIYHKNYFNGLQRFCCEINIFTPDNKFYVAPPQYSRDSSFNYWDIGFIDLKNMLFYEMSLLLNKPVPRILFFSDWINFLQFIGDSKLLSKLFEAFLFNKGILVTNDRLLYEAAFVRGFKMVANDLFGRDFILYLADIAKNNYKMVSYTMFKRLINSNLKNFKNH